MRTGAMLRETFGKRDSGDLPPAPPVDATVAGGRTSAPAPDRPGLKTTLRPDLHPLRVRGGYSLSEIF